MRMMLPELSASLNFYRDVTIWLIFYGGVAIWPFINRMTFGWTSLVCWVFQMAFSIIREPSRAKSTKHIVFEMSDAETQGDGMDLSVIMSTFLVLSLLHFQCEIFRIANYKLPLSGSLFGVCFAWVGIWIIWYTQLAIEREEGYYEEIPEENATPNCIRTALEYVSYPMYNRLLFF